MDSNKQQTIEALSETCQLLTGESDSLSEEELVGIADVMEVYGGYSELIEIAAWYLQTTQPKFTISTTDSSI